MRMTLNKERIGIVYQIEGETEGSRTYHLQKYDVSAIDTIQVRGSGSNRKVVFTNGGEEVDLQGTVKVYDEHQENRLAQAANMTKIAYYAARFVTTISSFVFEMM